MFGFKKSKAKRNIRKRDDGAAEGSLESDDTPVDVVVKRTAKPTTARRQEFRTQLGTGGTPSRTATATATAIRGNEMTDDEQIARHDDEKEEDNERTYSQEELAALKSGTKRPNDLAAMDVDLEKDHADSQHKPPSVYPFSSEGIPDAQDIYLAKRLRRQKQAEQKMDEVGDEEVAEDRDSDDFIALSDEMASSRIRGKTNQELFDDGAMVEGEDEMDTVIVGRNERAEFNRSMRVAKEESIEHAQADDEPSDWENEQLRNAGVAPMMRGRERGGQQPPHTTVLPKDTGNYKYDGSHLEFLLDQEMEQLALEEEQLRIAKERCEQSSKTLDDLTEQMLEAQKQWDHFSSLVRSLS